MGKDSAMDSTLLEHPRANNISVQAASRAHCSGKAQFEPTRMADESQSCSKACQVEYFFRNAPSKCLRELCWVIVYVFLAHFAAVEWFWQAACRNEAKHRRHPADGDRRRTGTGAIARFIKAQEKRKKENSAAGLAEPAPSARPATWDPNADDTACKWHQRWTLDKARVVTAFTLDQAVNRSRQAAVSLKTGKMESVRKQLNRRSGGRRTRQARSNSSSRQNRQFYTVGQFQRPIRVENGGVAALDWLSTLVRQVIGAMGLIYYFAWWRKFVVVLAPFRWNNCCHRLPFDPGHLCSIIRTKAYEKAASRAESGEKKAAWIE
ncbi:hypothetical protein T09_11241 [Trichinella sp. T9]|nr:hypothetical protein T09_11241 [Trichinella sp. T9]